MLDYMSGMAKHFDKEPSIEDCKRAERFFKSIHGEEVIGNGKFTLIVATYRDESSPPNLWTGPRHNVNKIKGDKTKDKNGHLLHRFLEYPDTGDLHYKPWKGSRRNAFKKRDPKKTQATYDREVKNLREMGAREWARIRKVATYASWQQCPKNWQGVRLLEEGKEEEDYWHCLEVVGMLPGKQAVGMGQITELIARCEGLPVTLNYIRMSDGGQTVAVNETFTIRGVMDIWHKGTSYQSMKSFCRSIEFGDPRLSCNVYKYLYKDGGFVGKVGHKEQGSAPPLTNSERCSIEFGNPNRSCPTSYCPICWDKAPRVRSKLSGSLASRVGKVWGTTCSKCRKEKEAKRRSSET